MEILFGMILVALVACIALLAVVLVKLQKLEKHHKKAKPVVSLTRAQQTQLHEEAGRQYEAMMVRELQRFEKSMQKFSDELLENMRQHVGQPDVQIAQTIEGLVGATTDGYSLALQEAVTALKARLSSVDALLASHAEAADKNVQALVEERKARAVSRADAALAGIFSDYMASVATNLDFGEQQDYVLAQLEAIKPQLLEDVKRVG